MLTLRSLPARCLLAALSLSLPLTCLHAQDTPSALTNKQAFRYLDPDMARVVRLFDLLRGTPAKQLTPQDARQQFSAQDAAKIIARGSGVAPAPAPVGQVTDGVTIAGRDGNQIPVRIYTPPGAGPFPVITYYHGGGFVIATIDTYDASARALCTGANAIVVSVEYRKAPEAPYPAALNDAIDSYTLGDCEQPHVQRDRYKGGGRGRKRGRQPGDGGGAGGPRPRLPASDARAAGVSGDQPQSGPAIGPDLHRQCATAQYCIPEVP